MPRRRKTPKPQPINLLSLPAELSSKIGRLAVDQKDTFYRHSSYYRDKPSKTLPHQPPITQVCRVLREELLPYFYKTKVSLSLDAVHDHCNLEATAFEMGRWLRAMGAVNRRDLASVWVRCSARGESVVWPKIIKTVWKVGFEMVPDEMEKARGGPGAICGRCAATCCPSGVCVWCREKREMGIVEEWEPSWYSVVFK